MKFHAPRMLILLGITVLLVSACSSPAEREAKALRRGNDYLEAGNLEKARIEYRNALQAVPNDAEARYRNGVLYERLGQIREAAQYYLGATEVDAKHEAARKALARLYIAGGAPDEALEALDIGLDQKPGDGVYLALRAAAKNQLKDRAGALEDAESAFKAKPDDEYVVAILAGILRSDGNTTRAREVLEIGARLIPKSADLRVVLASLEAETGHIEQSEGWLRQVIAIRSKEPAFRVALAQFLARTGQTAAAEKEIREARRLFPDDPASREGLVRFLIANRGAEAAESELRNDANRNPKDDNKRLLLATFLAETGHAEKAESEFGLVISHAGTSATGLSARSRLASLLLGRGDLTRAEKLVTEALVHSPRDAEALMVRGNRRLQRGDAHGAVDDLRAVSRDVPNSVPVLLSLGRAHASAGEAGLAEEALRRAVELAAGDSIPSLQLALFLLSQGRPGDARDVVAVPFRAAVNDQVLEETTLRAALGAHDHALAIEVIAKVRATPTGNARAEFYAGLVAVAEGHRDEALRHYLESVHRDPASPAAVAEAVKLMLANNHRADAIKLLEDVSAKVPVSGAADVLKGDLLLSARDLSNAEAAFREALKRQPRLATAIRGLAYVTLGRGDLDGAVRALDQSAAGSDDPFFLLNAAGQLLELAGRFDSAIGQYELAQKVRSSDAGLRAKLALLTLAVHDDADGRKRSGEWVNGFAESPIPRLRDAYAWVELKSGDIPGALRILERLAQDSPADALIQYHLGIAQNLSGNRDDARKALAAALATDQRFIGDADAKAQLQTLKAAH